MALLNAKLSHDTNKYYVPNTLEKHHFAKRNIKGFNTSLASRPTRLIENIFAGQYMTAKMLRTDMMINAYIPTDRGSKITELMSAMTDQSRHVSENKLNSAKRSVSSALAEWLQQCSPNAVISVKPDKEPDVQYQIKLHTSLTPKKYSTLCEGEVGEGVDSAFEWYPTFVKGKKWSRYVENPFNEDRKQIFDMQDSNKKVVRPPYRITLRSITVDVVPNKNSQFIDRRHFNAYQIIPGIMYELIARLSGRVQSHIINEDSAVKAINYVTRYCYATRGAPFDTMHPTCVSYNLKFNLQMNMCQGNDEAIPVTVLLVGMYNACYTYQGCVTNTDWEDRRMNLLILALRGLDQGGSMSDKSIIRTLSKYKQTYIIYCELHTYQNTNIFTKNSKIVSLGLLVIQHSSWLSTSQK